MKGFIYKITNRVNNKVYIGQTHFTVEHRFKQHIKNFNIEHRQQPLYNAFAKYGLENFSVETLEECDTSRLDEREMFWIAKYDSFKNGYNATVGGHGGHLYVWTDDQYSEIKSLYMSGFTIKKIAEMYGTSAYTIKAIINSLNLKQKDPLDMNKVEREEFIEWYKNGASLKFLAQSYHVSPKRIKEFLTKYNVDLRVHSQLLLNPSLIDGIIADLYDGMPIKTIETKYHADQRTIKKILTQRGIDYKAYHSNKHKTQNGYKFITEETAHNVVSDYKEKKLTCVQITKKYGINWSTIYDLCKKYGVDYHRYNCSKSVQSPNKG